MSARPPITPIKEAREWQVGPRHHEAFWDLLVGEPLGSGVCRQVFAMKGTDDWVVKVEFDRTFANAIEWETWNEAQAAGPKTARWFAPCRTISPNGAILIQRRTTRPTVLPRLMPSFLADFKHENYGMLDGRLVAHDYGLFHGSMSFIGARMVLANWW